MRKVLIVEDSLFMRQFLSTEVKKIDGLEVAGVARNGRDALRQLQEKEVDLITLDLKMPEMDGLQTLKKMNSMGNETPVLVVSSLTRKNAQMVAQVLELGAADVLPKPVEADKGRGTAEIKEEFLEKLKALAEEAPGRRKINKKIKKSRQILLKSKLNSIAPRLLVIGGSTGAPPILHSIVDRLPDDFHIPVVIVQHIQNFFLQGLADNLAEKTKLEVECINTPQKLEAGHIYIPGKNKHLLFRPGSDGVYVRLKGGEKVSGAKPSIDVTFQSALDIFQEDVISVLLTGMGRDGAESMEKLHNAGALCLGQDKESSVVYGMPGTAASLGALDLQVSASQIPDIICEWAKKTKNNSLD
jgi:two-component system chemotaxis response regulator CheB